MTHVLYATLVEYWTKNCGRSLPRHTLCIHAFDRSSGCLSWRPVLVRNVVFLSAFSLALLNYLDFFSIAVQRTALQAASNCCRNVSPEHFPMIRGVWPIIRNCLGYSDQRLVEFACLCVIRVVDSYYRSSPENLEALVDTDLIKAVNNLLMPAGGSPLIAPATFTLLLRALATSTKASPKITIATSMWMT